MQKLVILILMALTLSGCITYRATHPTGIDNVSTIYILENPATRKGFLKCMLDWLHKHQYNTQVLPVDSIVSQYEWVLKYNALWSWDIALYLSKAEIYAYHNGLSAGNSIFNIPGHSWNPSPAKYSRAEGRINKMMDNLFSDSKSILLGKGTGIEIQYVKNQSEDINDSLKSIDTTEEIRKYKKLMDEKIITKEEFEQKKIQLLRN